MSYIEREALLKELTVGEEYLDNDTMVAVMDTVVCFPAADVVEVVRCKDCKRCFKHTTRRYRQTMWLCMRHDFNVNVQPDDFCSYGERRTQDGH